MTGNIAEIIAFNAPLNIAERQRVETYLAIQYGITLSHNYYASDWDGTSGTTVWNVGEGYDYRIAGIGKDFYAALDQRQAKGEGPVEIYHGNVRGIFPTHNQENPYSFAEDRSFLIWGDNNGSVNTLGKTIYGGENHVVNRVWKIQNTGNTKVVTLRIAKNALPANVSAIYINSQNETNFPAGATTKVYTLSSNSDYLSTPVIFNDGDIFTFGDGKGELFPVEWMQVKVIQDGENALVEWATAKEKDSDYFAVERAADGINFTEIARVKAAGNSDILQTYWHEDADVYQYHSEKLFYRIRQVDVNGEYAYSQIAILNLLDESSQLQMTIQPNPARDKATIVVQTVKSLLLQTDVFNPNGQLLYHIRKPDPDGKEYIELPVHKWVPGIYYVRMSNGNESITEKLLVK